MEVIKMAGKGLKMIVFAAAVVILVAAGVCLVLQLRPAVVVSGSMEPAIATGSLILIDTKDREAEVGDVIAFKRGDAFVTHRVVEVTEEGYITKGDNNQVQDAGVVAPAAVVGTTAKAFPGLGFVVKSFGAPPVLAVAALAGLGLVAAGSFSRKEQGYEEAQ